LNHKRIRGVVVASVITVVGATILIVAINHHSHNDSDSTQTSSDSSSISSQTSSNTTAQPSIESTPQSSQTTSSPPTPSCLTASQSWNEIGQTGCVTFTGYAYTSDSGQMYLDQDSSNYSDGFSVWIPSGESFGASILNQYSGVPINVSGTITQYDGAPEIEVTSAAQIQASQ
jgi:hypothetical protein